MKKANPFRSDNDTQHMIRGIASAGLKDTIGFSSVNFWSPTKEPILTFIDYLRIYTDSAGCSHFEKASIELVPNDYAPPATPLNTSSLAPAEASIFLELPVGWYGDWHPSPVRQWLILMTGECEFEAGDGERLRSKAGDVVMLDDTSGKGHRTRVVGDVPLRITAIHFK